MSRFVESIALFLSAGFLEVAGGYLIWLWLRERRSGWLALLGGVCLFLYGVFPVFQPAPFGRVYAAYGGLFVALSLLWGWWREGRKPDGWDIAGALICLVGVLVILYAPRDGPGAL